MFKIFKSYKKTINNLQKENQMLKSLNEDLNLIIKSQNEELAKKDYNDNRLYIKDMYLLLKQNLEQKSKIEDLENNIELLYNNLSNKNKKIVPQK